MQVTEETRHYKYDCVSSMKEYEHDQNLKDHPQFNSPLPR